jgi:hypothetical protein
LSPIKIKYIDIDDIAIRIMDIRINGPTEPSCFDSVFLVERVKNGDNNIARDREKRIDEV